MALWHGITDPHKLPGFRQPRGGGQMWVLRQYETWLEFIRDLLIQPSVEFPRKPVQMRLAATLDTNVCWTWEDPDGAYGYELAYPIDDWPGPRERELFDSGAREMHPLLNWFRTTGDPRPMSIGRVPSSMIRPEGMALHKELMAPHGQEQQLSIPCHLGQGHHAFIPAKDGEDFSDEAFQLTRLIQPLLALVWLQNGALVRAPALTENLGLTGRELAVLQLLADGLTAEAIARRLGISPRTVHAHLGHLYRKLGVSDRMRAVLTGQAAGIIGTRTQMWGISRTETA